MINELTKSKIYPNKLRQTNTYINQMQGSNNKDPNQLQIKETQRPKQTKYRSNINNNI